MNSTSSENREACSSCNGWWRLPLGLALVLVAILALRGGVRDEKSQRPIQTRTVAMNQAGETVSLAIDFGDSTSRKFADLAWQEGMTVADALVAVSEVEPGARFSQQGSGKMAFLTELGHLRNEGAGGRNWTYAVNGRRADRSFAVYELEPGDRVLWSFAASQ